MTYLIQEMHVENALEIIYILYVYMSHANMEKLKVQTLILFLAKIIFPPYKIQKYPCTEKWAHETSSFPKDSSQAKLCWGWEIFHGAINNPLCCLLLFTPILAFLFLLQYLKTYGEQLLKISQWTPLKGLLREVPLVH